MAAPASDCETTDRIVDSSEIKHRVKIEKKGPEKRNDQTEMFHKNLIRDRDVEDKKEIDYGLGIVESGANSLESMKHSDNVSGSTIDNKIDRNLLHIKARDVDAEAKPSETVNLRPYLISRDLSPVWGSYILAVKGIPPRESGKLKLVLNDVLGINRHRVRPRHKGDTIVHLHFLTLEDMRIAKETLTTHGVANYKLTVTVECAEGQKSKPEDGNEGPVSKKMKHDLVFQFYEEAYEKQIDFKVKDISSRLQDLEKDILEMYPIYSGLIDWRRIQHDGVICAVEKLRDCPASYRVASTCWFTVGLSEETGKLALGIYQGSGCMQKLSSVKHNYPDHVVKAAEVFEEFLLAAETRKVCRKLLIYTNHVKDLMLLVFVHDIGVVQQVAEEMKVFFTSGDGAKCHVISIHIKVMKSNHDIKDGAMQLVFGVPCLDEMVANLKLQLPPVKNLWNTVHGAEMLCQAVEELLVPSRKMTVLDIGCGIGLLGLYLSKIAGEVLGVDTDSAVAVATKNATLNGITGCRYFSGEAEIMIPVLAKKKKYDSVCAVVTCCINSSYRSGRVMEELRKIQYLNRLVLIEDRTVSSSAILSLNKPSSDKKMGNPFFPLKVVPVDSLPNSKSCVLLVLLERIDNDDMKKFGIGDKTVAAGSELDTRGGASRKPYGRDPKPRLRQGGRHLLLNTLWEREAFSQQSYDIGVGAVQNSLLQNTVTLSASHSQFQAADVLRAYVGNVNNLTSVAKEYELRRQMEEDYHRQMVEEEHRQWLAEEEQRRRMEEVQLRQIEEEEWKRQMYDGRRSQVHVEDEWIRRVHNEQMRKIHEEECRRTEEEEWRRRIREEEQMRLIQEVEWRKRIQEEQMRHMKWEEQRRRIQEEERRKQIDKEKQKREIEEQQMRRIQEEKQMRRIQEEHMRQIQEEERIRWIQEEEHRIIQEQEWRRQVREDEWRKHIQEEERRMEEEEWRRKIQVDEQRKQIQVEQRKIEEEEWRKQIQKEEQRIKEVEWRRRIHEEEQKNQIEKDEQRRIQEEEWRRQSQRENQKRLVLDETCSEQVKEEELRRKMKDERERELVRSSDIRNRNDMVQNLIADSLRAAAIPQISAGAAQKVKQLVAEATRTVGVIDQGTRHGVDSSREVGGISPDHNTSSQFGMSDKEISRSRHMEEEYLRYIREVESAYYHNYDTSGGAVGRYSSELNDLNPVHQAVVTKPSEKLPSLMELKLWKHPQLSVQCSEDKDFSLDVDTNQWQRRMLTECKELGSHAEHDRLANRSFNLGKQTQDLLRRDEKSAFSSANEKSADIYVRRRDLDQGKLRSTTSHSGHQQQKQNW